MNHAPGGQSHGEIRPQSAHYASLFGRNTLKQLKQATEDTGVNMSSEDCRKLWIEAVEQMAENAELKARIDFLERQIATNSFAGWQLH